MNIEDIPVGCRGCEYILPYIRDIRRLERDQITPEARQALVEQWGLENEDIDWFDTENHADLEESHKALESASVRTIGCAGLKVVREDVGMLVGANFAVICQSPLELLGDDQVE